MGRCERRRVLVDLNREGRLPDAVLDDALDLLRCDPGKLSGGEVFYREKVVGLSEGRLLPHAFLDVWSTRGHGMTAEPSVSGPSMAEWTAEMPSVEAPPSPAAIPPQPLLSSRSPTQRRCPPSSIPARQFETPPYLTAYISPEKLSRQSFLRSTPPSWVKPVALAGLSGDCGGLGAAVQAVGPPIRRPWSATSGRAQSQSAPANQVTLRWRIVNADSVVLVAGCRDALPRRTRWYSRLRRRQNII